MPVPITYSIDRAARLVRTTVTGPLLDTDPLVYLSRLLEDPDFQPGLRILAHCTKVELGSFSVAGVRRFAQATREAEHLAKGVRVAIVAEQSVAYGMARMYQLLRNPPYALRVFREMEDAQAWLAEEPLRTAPA